MKSHCCLVVAFAGLAAVAGCAGPQVSAHVESVNAEYRQLEDYVYCLEDENAKLQRRMDHIEHNYERVLRGEAPERIKPFQRKADESSGSGSAADEPPVIEVPGNSSPNPPKASRSSLQRPKLELAPPAIELPGPETSNTPSADDLPTPSIPRERTSTEPEALPIPPADTQVTHLFLNPLLTGGADFDRQPGDEGLSVVIEPRNAADQYVPQAGAVSIVVLDPEKQGEAARVARWDFTLTATQEKLQTASAARGILLEMPWPATPPSAGKLKVFVRYEAADGRRLQTDREIFITPPGQVAQRWTPRPADRSAVGNAVPGVPPVPTTAAPPKPSPLPAIVSKIPAAAASPPQLLSPPAALSGQPKDQLAAPQWSPYR